MEVKCFCKGLVAAATDTGWNREAVTSRQLSNNPASQSRGENSCLDISSTRSFHWCDGLLQSEAAGEAAIGAECCVCTSIGTENDDRWKFKVGDTQVLNVYYTIYL